MDNILYQNRDGVRRTMIPQDENRFTIHTELELDGILESIKRDRELHPTRSTNKLLARVPMTVFEKALLEDWDDDDWKKWLNDPDNVHLRVWQGRV